jgi:hypothetical protein
VNTLPVDRKRTLLQQAVIIILLVSLGVLVGRWSAPNSVAPPEAQTEDDSAVTEDAGPREEINGVPVGYARTEEGAILAATNFAQVMTAASDESADYKRAMRTLATPEWAGRSAELAENTIAFVEERYGQGGFATFAPLRYRVTSYSVDNASVDLWGVLVATGPKIQRIDESWLVATVELDWVDGDWRVGGQGSQAGPTPQLLQTQDGTPETELDGFEEYSNAARP